MYQDAVRLLQPTISFLRICGVCPSALRRIHVPYINKFYALIVLITIFYAYVFLMQGLHVVLNDISCFYGILRYLVNAGSILVILVSGFFTSHKLVHFFRVVRSIQKCMFRLNINQPIFPSVALQAFWLAFHAIPIFTSTIALILDQDNPLNIVVYGFVSLAREGLVCKARVLMDLLRHKLTLLNWHLKYLNHYWPPFLPRPVKEFKELSEEMEWRRSKFVYVGMDTEKLTPEKVKEFNKTHLKLHYAYRKLNSILSLPLFLFYISSGLNISFYIFLLACDSLKNSDLAAYTMIYQEIVGILLISSLSSMCEKEFQTTAHLVHNLLDDETHSPAVTKELENFSMILLHRRTTFSAAGFFDTNLKTITRMASLLAPIVLFLVQNNNRSRAARNTQQ